MVRPGRRCGDAALTQGQDGLVGVGSALCVFLEDFWNVIHDYCSSPLSTRTLWKTDSMQNTTSLSATIVILWLGVGESVPSVSRSIRTS